jgi:hypothetical protein
MHLLMACHDVDGKKKEGGRKTHHRAYVVALYAWILRLQAPSNTTGEKPREPENPARKQKHRNTEDMDSWTHDCIKAEGPCH